MSLNAAALRIMQEKGLTLDDVVQIAAAMEVRKDNTAADRKRRQRERDKSRRDVTRDTPLDEYISNPPEKPLSANADPSLSEKIGIVVSEWNEMAGRIGLSKVVGTLTGKRLASLKARIAEHGLDGCRQAIAAVDRSPFCRGETKDWRADFKFFVVPDNFVKLLEGGYDPPSKVTPISAKPMSDIDRQRTAIFGKLQAGEITDEQFERERTRLDRLEADQRRERMTA